MERGAEKTLVKERVSLRDVVAEVVGELKPRGHDSLWACCPFHQEDTPSFHVRPALGVYKCFGCGESGDVFSFVQKTRGVGFREALEILAERAGIELGSLTPAERRQAAEVRRTRDGLEAALALFRRALASGEGRAALAYMRRRGFRDETLRRFDIGYIPAGFQRTLRQGGMDARQLDGAGFTAAFGGRLGFGIRDAHGALVGFGARRLDDGVDGPKYVNTRETPWFSKGRLLYGLDKASRALVRGRRLVVMEGYTDVMMAHQAGLEEAVATMGTSFTEEHLRLVKARVSNLVLVFDGDEAGRTAAERACRRLLNEGSECRVLLLEGGSDPCDWFAERGMEQFEQLLESSACSSVEFLGRRLLERQDAGQPGGREEVARELIELSARLTDPLRRETVIREIADICGLDRNLLRRRGGVVSAAPTAAPTAPRGPVKAIVRSQFVAVAGLAQDGGRWATVRQLSTEGCLGHPGAAALLELAEALAGAAGEAPDASEWLEVAMQRSIDLGRALERALLPPPDLVLPTWEEAVEHLRRQRATERAREQVRITLSNPDIATNGELLKSVQSSLAAARGHQAPGGSRT